MATLARTAMLLALVRVYGASWYAVRQRGAARRCARRGIRPAWRAGGIDPLAALRHE